MRGGGGGRWGGSRSQRPLVTLLKHIASSGVRSTRPREGTWGVWEEIGPDVPLVLGGSGMGGGGGGCRTSFLIGTSEIAVSRVSGQKKCPDGSSSQWLEEGRVGGAGLGWAGPGQGPIVLAWTCRHGLPPAQSRGAVRVGLRRWAGTSGHTAWPRLTRCSDNGWSVCGAWVGCVCPMLRMVGKVVARGLRLG